MAKFQESKRDYVPDPQKSTRGGGDKSGGRVTDTRRAVPNMGVGPKEKPGGLGVGLDVASSDWSTFETLQNHVIGARGTADYDTLVGYRDAHVEKMKSGGVGPVFAKMLPGYIHAATAAADGNRQMAELRDAAKRSILSDFKARAKYSDTQKAKVVRQQDAGGPDKLIKDKRI